MAEGNLGELVAYLGADISQMQQALKHAESLLKNYDRTSAQVVNSSSSGFSKIATGATRAFSTMQKGISSVSNALFFLKTAIAGFGVGMLAKSFIDAASQAEILRMRLQTLTGHGKELFDILHNWAARMPVDTAKAIDVFTMLTGYGLKPTLDMMTTLVDTGLALSGTTEGFYNIALALGQIQTHGRLLGGELRQLASAGYNAAEVLREEFNLTAKEMENLGETLTKRGISASQIINILLEDMKERFGGMSKAMESSWTGLVERIEEAWWNLRLMIAESGPFKLLKEQLDKFLQAWESAEGQLKIREWAEEAGAAIVNALKMAINAAKLLLPHLEKILRILIAMKGISVGAALGTAVGGPVGAVIGSTVGGVAGYLSPEILRGIFGEKEARKGIEELQKALAELDKQKSELEKELQKISEDSAKSWLHRPIFGGAKEEVVRKQITAIDDARQKIITAIEEYKKDLDAASENIAHGKSMEELLGGKGKGEGAAGGGGAKNTAAQILADINWAYQQGLTTLENFYAKASSMLSGLTKSSEDFQSVFATTQAAAMELATKRMEEYTASFISGGMSVDEYNSKVKELLGSFSQFPLAGKAIEELSGKGLIERSKAVNAEIMLSIELSKRMEQELLDAQEAATQGVAKFWSEVAWEYQQGFISSQEYFDMLKSEV
ncbi:MAG TPA: tape measure protein, partial [Candidatus Hydrothermia bacterium]|nr:tape measure protein [Candidatus Hydrothermia bacterium]